MENKGIFRDKPGAKEIESIKANLRDLFERHDDQGQVIGAIYRLAFPDWDSIAEVDGWPKAGSELWKFICGLFQEFDRKHHPNCFPGGAWLNWGFSSEPDLGPWDFSLKACKVTYSTT